MVLVLFLHNINNNNVIIIVFNSFDIKIQLFCEHSTTNIFRQILNGFLAQIRAHE